VGKAVKAASEDMEAAALVGISPHAVNGVAFAIGIALLGQQVLLWPPPIPLIRISASSSPEGHDRPGPWGMGSVTGAFLGGILLVS